MYFTYDKEKQINDLLNRIGSKLQLNKTRKERIESSYVALCEWIENDSKYFSKYSLLFYPQGSYKIETTVKPLSGEEFDLDFVLEISGDWKNENPIKLLTELKRRLEEHETYKGMIEVKTRCIRINYANEFHVDILPGFPENKISYDRKIKVPDTTLMNWTDSNPKGYAEWFNSSCKKLDRILLEKSMYAEIERLPEGLPYEYKEPLRRAVQLIKRFRDTYYKDKDGFNVRSIILTTLAATHYDGEISEYKAISNILKKIIKSIEIAGNKPIEIYNPTNSKEKLSDKWDENKELYDEFCSFIKYFYDRWIEISELESLEERVIVLKELFGENVSNEALLEQSNYVSKLRKNNALGINTCNGSLVAVTEETLDTIKPIKRNTFYGD